MIGGLILAGLCLFIFCLACIEVGFKETCMAMLFTFGVVAWVAIGVSYL